MKRIEKTETKIEDEREKSDEANAVCDEMERTEKTETKIEDETEISDEANTVCDEMERTETLNTKIVDEREKSDEANTACDEIERTEKTETQIKNNSKTVEVTFSTQTQINIEEEREKSDEEDEEDYPTQSKNNSKSVEVTFNPVKVKGKVKTSNRNALYRKILENIENSEIIHKEQPNTGKKRLNKSIPKIKLKEMKKKEQDSPENEDDNSDDTEEENEIILTENMHVDEIIDTKKIKEHKTLKKGEKLHEDDATSSQANTKRKLSNASIPNMKLKKKKKKEQDSLENEDEDENSDTEKKKIISTKNNRDDKKGERIYEDDAPLSKLSQAIQKRNTGSGKLKYNKIKKKEQDCFESEGDDTDVAEEENTIIFESDDEIDELNEDINENENEASSDEEETLDSILQWSQKSIPVRKPKFVGPLPGASTNFNLKNEATELEYFMKYLPENLFETMAINTNKYKPIYENFRNAKVLDFEQITTDDIRSFIACRMVMGVNVNPAVDDYWSSDPTLRNHFISKTLTRKRFRMISRYYHINDPTQDPTRLKKARNSDPLYKVNPLLTHLNKQCADLYNLNQEVSVDEAMIKFHGQHSGTIGAPFKPAKRGFRIFALADGHNGYISNFEVYLRKKEREVGLTKRVVEDLMATILGRNHIVFVDKFYTSTSLALSLLSKNTYISGSFNISRQNFPDDLKPKKGVTKKKDPVRSLQRGECLSRQTKDGKLVACVWKDSALVYNLNTCYNILINTTTAIRKHRVDGKWVQDTIPCPQPIREFNKYMGGVDTHDHIRSSYTTQRKSRIWWHYFTWFSVDLALSNSYLLWKVRHKGSHKSFQLEVCNLCCLLSTQFVLTH